MEHEILKEFAPFLLQLLIWLASGVMSALIIFLMNRTVTDYKARHSEPKPEAPPSNDLPFEALKNSNHSPKYLKEAIAKGAPKLTEDEIEDLQLQIVDFLASKVSEVSFESLAGSNAKEAARKLWLSLIQQPPEQDGKK